MSEPRIFIGIPSYSGQLSARAAQSVYEEATRHMKMVLVNQTSLLCYGFNSLWCAALNMREEAKITHFAMLHADIQPEPGWLDTMIEEMDKEDADVISAVVPLKDGSGITSTAIGGSGRDPWHPRRLTLRECSELPETFCADDVPWSQGIGLPGRLLVNTGCLVCRFTAPWVERVCFTISDKIRRTPDGRFEPRVFPEDWNFSGLCGREDLRVVATTKVRLTHLGNARYPNYGTYGQMTDEANTPAAPSSPADNDERSKRDEVVIQTSYP